MANNTTLNTGAGGDTIATDDVAGVKYQRVKLMDGTEDSTAVIPGDATNGLDVDVTRVSGTVTIAGAVTNAGTFAVQDSQVLVDNAGFTDGTSKIFPVGLIFDEVAGTALTENDVAAPRIDAKRATIGVLEDATTRGQRAAVSAGGALKVDNSAVTQPISGNVTNAGTFAVQDSEKITDNAAFTDGTSKVMMSGYVFDEVAGTALTENDAAAARIDSKRSVVSVIEDATTRGQRATVSAANALKVDGSAVTQPTNTAQVAGTTTDTNSGVKSAGTQRIVIATDQPQLTNALKVDASATTQPISGNVGLLTRTSGGLSIFRSLDLNVTDVAVKASAGQVYGWTFTNTGAAFAWVKFYDLSTASTTIGSSTPVITFGIPAGASANVFNDMGVAFATAITIGATTGIADADTTAPSANQVSGQVFYA